MRYLGDHYGKIYPGYWTGRTGRAIQAKGSAAVIVGAYLFSTRHSNMIGLYDLPLLYAAADLPVLDGVDDIRAALADLADVGYAHYDDATAMVWVVEGLRYRCGLDRYTPLSERDSKLVAIERLYRTIKPTALLAPFYARYAEQMRLGSARVDVPTPDPSTGPARGLHGSSTGPARDTDDPRASAAASAESTHTRTEEPQQYVTAEQSNKPHSTLSLSVPSEEGALTPPLDEWYRELVAAYPRGRVNDCFLSVNAFHDQFRTDPRPAAEVWRDIRAGLENQKRGHEWRNKGMAPMLDKWLRERRWQQRHEAQPLSAMSRSSQTTLAAMQTILGEKKP